MTNEELQQKIEQLEEQIKDLKVKLKEKAEKKPYEVEVPEDVEDYYYVDETGEINFVKDIFHETDYEGVYQRGLAFKTRAEAEQFDKERILINKFKDWAKKYNEGWTVNWNDRDAKYFVEYEYGRFLIKYNTNNRTFTKLPYFKSEEIAREFVKEFRDEIIEVLC